MIIQSSAIPHRWRNRFLRESSSNFVGSVNSTTVTPSSDGYQFEPHYLWGQYFDDTEDIDGDLTSNGTIQGVKGIFDNVDVHNNLQANHGIFGSAKVNGLLDTNQLKAVSGYIQTLLSDNITTDYLTVTKAAHFFKLIIDEIKASQGAVIITPANAKLDKVEEIENGYRCYYRANDDDGNQIYNCFEVNDQVVCQTFNASTGTSYNVSNKYYWRLVTATGSTATTIDGKTRDVHYFDLSSTDCDLSSSTPSVGDECVLLGNRSDTTRQAAIIISSYNSEFLDKGLKAPSFVQYAGINDYNLSNHRLNIISNGLNQFKGAYSNNSGTDIEQIISTTASTLDGKITTLNGTVSSHTKSISELVQTDSELKSSISSNTESIGTLNDNLGTVSGAVSSNTASISTLQQTASSLTSTVSSHTQSITTINSNINGLSGSISSNTESISNLEQTADNIKTTVSSNTTDISTLSGTVGTQGTDISSLSGTVTSHTESISTLNQTASGLSSTVSSHTQSISGLSGDVGTIKSDYVTSSQLTQTASGISATVTSDIEGKLLNTGINITTNKITMSSDNTEFVSASGSKTWLVGKASDNTEIFRLGRDGNYSAELYIKNTTNNYTRLKPYSVYVQNGIQTWGVSVEDYPFMQMYNGNNRLALRWYNGRVEKQKDYETTWTPVFAQNARTVSANTTLNATDSMVICTNTNVEITITLPTEGNYIGRTIKILRLTHNVLVKGHIQGEANHTVGIGNNYEIQEYIYAGTTWVGGYQGRPS